ncbi:MAG: TraM recognition domain-containing protein, partial [Clostridia bacterium]|nr:TraM recognition domain-containing protein [Clostridia bacterium]
IVLQNISQLKALFKDDWEGIIGNADAFVYLGGNEQSTHKYVSELLGKETIDTNSYGKSDGMRGNFSTNYQVAGRELMTADEVRMLDNKYAIVFIRGERPVLDYKYNIHTHPNVSLGADGGAGVYDHGEVKFPTDGLEIVSIDEFPGKTMEDFPLLEDVIKGKYFAYADEEVDALCKFISQ